MPKLKLEGEPFVNEYNSAEVIGVITYKNSPKTYSSQAPEPTTEQFADFLEENLLPILKASKPAICNDPKIILPDGNSLYAVCYQHIDRNKSLNINDIKKKLEASIATYNKQIAEKERSATLFRKPAANPATKPPARPARACRK